MARVSSRGSVHRLLRLGNCLRICDVAVKAVLVFAAVLAITGLCLQGCWSPGNDRSTTEETGVYKGGIVKNHTQSSEFQGGSWEDDDPLDGRIHSSYNEGTQDVAPETANGIEILNSMPTNLKGAEPEGGGERALEMEGADHSTSNRSAVSVKWEVCRWQGAENHVPCLDTLERSCPSPQEMPECLVPVPEGYRKPIRWPHSRQTIWYNNVPRDQLLTYKSVHNSIRRRGNFLLFPGHRSGASRYIEFLQETQPGIRWGTKTRVVLDIGCGVASFGGHLFDRDVLTLSFGSNDENEAQIQVALERGIPAFLEALTSHRLPFPGNVYDVVHCAHCVVDWHLDEGRRLLEVDRILRPGGYFVWSAAAVYKQDAQHVSIWRAVVSLARRMCWTLVSQTVHSARTQGAAIFLKSSNDSCLDMGRDDPIPLCPEGDDADSPLQACQSISAARAQDWPKEWPARLTAPPAWTDYDSFYRDTGVWRWMVEGTYLTELNVDWSSIRNVVDMRARFGSFAAALVQRPLWVLNVVDPVSAERDMLPVIFDRGLVGMYHDWCNKPLSTHPRTYDLVHADHALSSLQLRCTIHSLLLEVDRILRPGGWFILRDRKTVLRSHVHPVVAGLQWKRIASHHGPQQEEELLVLRKSMNKRSLKKQETRNSISLPFTLSDLSPVTL